MPPTDTLDPVAPQPPAGWGEIEGDIPAKPDAAFLAQVLEDGPDGQFWPREEDGSPMRWKYIEPCMCGMGVAMRIWPDADIPHKYNKKDVVKLGELFGLSEQNADFVFWSQEDQIKDRDITPADVATALRAALAQRTPQEQGA